MFPSVRERAQQFLNGGQAPVEAPSPPVSVPPRTATSKTVSSKPTPSKSSAAKPTPAKSSSSKPVPPKAALPPPSTPAKSTPAKSPSVKPASPKATPSKPKSKPTPSKPTPSASTPSKPTPSRTKSTPAKPTPLKIAPPKFTRSKSAISSSSSSSDDDTPEHTPADAQVIDLKAACLKQASSVTGLQGRSLAITLRKTSASNEWYAALKDLGSDKYLKMWMNRNKTYPTQIEALEAYLVFVKKMKADCRLFPMSPRTSKGK